MVSTHVNAESRIHASCICDLERSNPTQCLRSQISKATPLYTVDVVVLLVGTALAGTTAAKARARAPPTKAKAMTRAKAREGQAAARVRAGAAARSPTL